MSIGPQWKPCPHGYFTKPCPTCREESKVVVKCILCARETTFSGEVQQWLCVCGKMNFNTTSGEMESGLKDSGGRRSFPTGAVRDAAKNKGAFHLLPSYGLLLAAQQMEQGAAKYDDRNWEKGMPLSVFFNSADRHMRKFIAGFNDEPHLSAAIWNLLCLAEGQERIKRGLWPAELDDIPTTYAGLDPGF